jgi:hypothetical protein
MVLMASASLFRIKSFKSEENGSWRGGHSIEGGTNGIMSMIKNGEFGKNYGKNGVRFK